MIYIKILIKKVALRKKLARKTIILVGTFFGILVVFISILIYTLNFYGLINSAKPLAKINYQNEQNYANPKNQNIPTTKPTPNYREPLTSQLDDGRIYYKNYLYEFSLILPKGFNITTETQERKDPNNPNISNGKETFELHYSKGGGSTPDSPGEYYIYGGKLVKKNVKGLTSGCYSDCYEIILLDRYIIFDSKNNNYSVNILRDLIMSFRDEEKEELIKNGSYYTEKLILDDIEFNFRNYDTVNILSLINGHNGTGFGVAGNNNTIGGVYFAFHKNDNGIWETIWQGNEFPLCQDVYVGYKYSCPWDPDINK